MTEIQTARLLLRPWQPDDLAEFTRLLTAPEVTRYIVVHTPFSPQDVAELSERTLEQWERNGFGPWAAIEKQTGRWVGRIGLDELADWPGPDKVEVGWELHRAFWGRGLATEGGRAGVRYGFETVGLERIISVTMATNAASRRVMEKCGLRFQGELPMAGTVVAWYAIDRADWQNADQRSQDTSAGGPAKHPAPQLRRHGRGHRGAPTRRGGLLRRTGRRRRGLPSVTVRQSSKAPARTPPGYVAHAVHEETPLLRALPRASTQDNDEVEWQGGRVYLHLGVRRDDPPRR